MIRQKCGVSSSIFNMKMATQKFTDFDKFFLMHNDSYHNTNKIVLNEAKDN